MKLAATLANDIDGSVYTSSTNLSDNTSSHFGGCSPMIDLAQRSEPYEFALPYGVSVTVNPLTTASMAAAQAAARRAVEAIERQARERKEAGCHQTDCPTSRPRGSATASIRRS
jgi:hypothetical protein